MSANIEDTFPHDALAARVWAGDHYHYPGIEAMIAELASLRAAHAAEIATLRRSLAVAVEECKAAKTFIEWTTDPSHERGRGNGFDEWEAARDATNADPLLREMLEKP